MSWTRSSKPSTTTRPTQGSCLTASGARIRYAERLAAAGIEASVGSRGDAYDNALADDVECATQEWVAWFNTCRLLEPLGHLRPAEYALQSERLAAAIRLREHSTN